MNTQTINLNDFGGPVFAGRPRGERIREELKLDRWDKESATVDVIIPDSTLGITASFIGGLFAKSVIAAGSREAFFRRFRFNLPKSEDRDKLMMKVIEAEVDRALFHPRPLLNG